MKKIAFILSALAVLLLPSANSNATQIAAVKIERPYSYETAPSQKNGVVLLTLHNTGDKDLKITSVGVKPDIAGRAELHTHIMDGNTMMMRQVDSYDIPAGQSLTLSPMGDHIMVMDLVEPLKTGETLAVTLGFEDGSVKQIDVPVITPGTKPESSTEPKMHSHDRQNHSHH